MNLVGWYVSFIVHVFPVTVQETVQRPLLTHVKDSVVTVPTGTPLVPTRDSHVFLDDHIWILHYKYNHQLVLRLSVWCSLADHMFPKKVQHIFFDR